MLAPALALAVVLPATYSIVAADQQDGTLGAAGASCVGANVIRILGFARGQGLVHAQSYMNAEARDEAARRLEGHEDPEAILSFITGADFDPDAARRQYGLVDRLGRRAAFTGEDCGPEAGHRLGRNERYVWAVQGNLLTGAPVLDRAASAFEESACDLPERLLRALEAGAEGGEGDARCTPRGLPSDSAFVAVLSPLGPAHDLVLTADEAETESPLVSLRRQLEAWRAEHPCPSSPIPDAGPRGSDSGPGPGGARADAGAPPAAGARRGAGEDSSCACRGTSRVVEPPWGWLGWLLLLTARRRTLGSARRP